MLATGINPFGGAALTHGFEVAFYVLAASAAVGAVLAALLIESRPAQAEPVSGIDRQPCASNWTPEVGATAPEAGSAA
jgi:hypothetical protein